MNERNWKIFNRDSDPHYLIDDLLNDDNLCPPWRNFKTRYYPEEFKPNLESPVENDLLRGKKFRITEEMAEMVNAALYLRRPLLITGPPGAGKSSLIYAVAHQLNLGKVLRWPVNSRSALRDAIYSYDAIGRLQDAQIESEKERSRNIGRYLRLGPLGTALLPYKRPRALLIDEIDKSDVDLPNDLLNIFEEGEYTIPELARLKNDGEDEKESGIKPVYIRPYDSELRVEIRDGRLLCFYFPFIVLTSNRERDFSPPFLRRCLRLEIDPSADDIRQIVLTHLGENLSPLAENVIRDFNLAKDNLDKELATDQLLNAVFLDAREAAPKVPDERLALLKKLLRPLND
jgi:MoxR-like ATPase